MFLAALTAPPAWYFRKKGVGDTPAAPREEGSESTVLGAYTVTRTRYTVAGGRATRTTVSDGREVALVVDSITLDESRAVYTPIALPMKENLSCNVVSRDRLVLRAETGAKLFRIGSTIDGKPTEGAGLLLPDGLGEGSLRFSFYSGLYGYGKRHTAAYAVCEDSLANIIYWHIEGDGTTVVSDTTHTPRIALSLGEGSFTLTVGDTNQIFEEE